MPRKKSSPGKRVAVIFNIPAELRDELQKKIPAGYRSEFVVELIVREFKKSSVIAPTTVKKGFFSRIFRK